MRQLPPNGRVPTDFHFDECRQFAPMATQSFHIIHSIHVRKLKSDAATWHSSNRRKQRAGMVCFNCVGKPHWKTIICRSDSLIEFTISNSEMPTPHNQQRNHNFNKKKGVLFRNKQNGIEN